MAQNQAQAQAQAKPDVVPLPHEYGDGVKRWQRELEGLHGHYDSQKALAEREFHAQRDKIRVSVLHRRQEQIAKLDADIHQYMHSVKLGLDSLLEELQTEKLHRLETSFKGQLSELEKMRDQDMLKHLKKYRTILGGSGEEPPEMQQPSRSPLGAAAASQPSQLQKGKELEVPAQRHTPTHQFRQLPPPMSTVDHRAEASRPPIGHRPGTYPLPPILSSNYPPAPTSVAPAHPGMQAMVYGAPPPMPQMKRRMDEQESPERGYRKRQRVSMGMVDEHGVPLNREDGPAGNTRRASGGTTTAAMHGAIAPTERKTLTFEEVYQDGNPEYKHIIVEYPVESNVWYILRCDEHIVHFGLKPLLGAAKHLHSTQHNNLPKHHSLAVELLGITVTGCDAEKVAKNNAMVAKAFEAGYHPFNVNRLTRTEKINQGFSVAETGSERKQQAPMAHVSPKQPIAVSPSLAVVPKLPKVFNGTTHPHPGQLYVGFWTKTKQRYAVMVFPFVGGIPDTPLWSAKDAAGNVRNIGSIGLVANAPRCIRVSRSTQTVIGWAKDYEDGGPLVMKREFPVVYFDKKYQIGWLACRNIKPFNFDEPHPETIHDYHESRDMYATLRGYKDYADMRADQPHGPPFLKREEIAAGALSNAKSPAQYVSERTKEAFGTPSSPEHRDNMEEDDETEDKMPQSMSGSLHHVAQRHNVEKQKEAEQERTPDHSRPSSGDSEKHILQREEDTRQLAAMALQGAAGGLRLGAKTTETGTAAKEASAAERPEEFKSYGFNSNLPRISTIHGIMGQDQPSSASSLSSAKSAISPTEGSSITVPNRQNLNDKLSPVENSGRHALPGGRSTGLSSSLASGPGRVVSESLRTTPLASPSLTSIDNLSRHSTPTTGGPDMGWRAIRPSYSASPQQSFASLAEENTLSASKNASRIAAYATPALTPGDTKKTDPLVKSLSFDIARFFSDGRRFVRDDDEDSYLRLVVDEDKGIAETGPDASMHLKIDPKRFASASAEHTNDTTTAVQLTMADKTVGRQRLFFESNVVCGRIITAKEQAERFVKWLREVNDVIELEPGRSGSDLIESAPTPTPVQVAV